MYRNFINILITTVLIGCSGQDIPIQETCYVSFSNGVFYDITNTLSRAEVFESNFIPKDKIVGIYGFESTWNTLKAPEDVTIDNNWEIDDIRINCNNAAYVSQGVSKILRSTNNSELTYPAGEKAALVFYGYYPYSDNLVFDEVNEQDKGPKIAIEIDPTMKTTKEYLYTGSVPSVPSDTRTTINLPFKHALSLLHFKIFTKDSKYTGNNCPQLTHITVTTKESQTGWMYIKDGSIGQNQGAATKTTFTYELPTPFKISVNNEDSDTKAKFLLLPANNAIDKIILTIKNTDGSTEDHIAYKQNDLNPGRNVELIKGARHIVNIEYNVRIQITNSVETWTPSDDNNNLEIN